jgi:outer membrane protein TolC
MKRKISITAAILLTSISVSICAGAVSAKLYNDMKLKDLMDAPDEASYYYKIYQYEKDNSELNYDDIKDQIEYYETEMNKSTDLSKYYEYKLKLLSLDKDLSAAELEKEYYKDKDELDKKVLQYKLQKEYYSLCLINGKLEANQKQLDYLKLAYEIEQTKYKQGQSTENAVALAEADMQFAENTNLELKNSYNAVKVNIANLLNQYDNNIKYSFILDIPDNIKAFSKSQEKLSEDFLKENYELKKLRNQKESEEKYVEEIEKIYSNMSSVYKQENNTFEKRKLELEMKEADYKASAAEKYSKYESAKANYETSCEYRKALNKKLTILKSSLDAGQISELEYLKQQAQVYSAFCDCDNASVEYICAVDELELMDLGIILE